MNGKRIISSIILISSNLVPLVGIKFYGWNAFNILLLYWLEGLILGIFTIIKIVRSEKQGDALVVQVNNQTRKLTAKREIIKTYLLFLGTFGFLHGLVIFLVFRKGPILWQPVLIALATLTISHVLSYFINYLGSQEYKQYSPRQLVDGSMMRLVVMHFVVWAGAFFFGGKPTSGVVILVILKILIDLGRHNQEHAAAPSDV